MRLPSNQVCPSCVFRERVGVAGISFSSDHCEAGTIAPIFKKIYLCINLSEGERAPAGAGGGGVQRSRLSTEQEPHEGLIPELGDPDLGHPGAPRPVAPILQGGSWVPGTRWRVEPRGGDKPGALDPRS